MPKSRGESGRASAIGRAAGKRSSWAWSSALPKSVPPRGSVYKDQPRGEWLRIAMEAITGSDGDRFILAVRVNDGVWLDGDYGHPEFFWEADGRFVFLRR